MTVYQFSHGEEARMDNWDVRGGVVLCCHKDAAIIHEHIIIVVKRCCFRFVH